MTEVHGIELRHKVVHGSLASLGHMEVNIFSVLVGTPWNLANGDIQETMAWLRSLDSPPAGVLARKAWSLLQAGIGERIILEGLTLLKECSFSPYFSEKMHGSTASVSKLHPEYGAETLCNRAFVHLSRWVSWDILICSRRGRRPENFFSVHVVFPFLGSLPKGSKRCFPNGVFQIPHLGLRQRKAPAAGRRML